MFRYFIILYLFLNRDNIIQTYYKHIIIMKSTKKKLKTKHFRYLSKAHIKDPDRFIEEIILNDKRDWASHINHFLTSTFYPQMRSPFYDGLGGLFTGMKQMIEIAFIIISYDDHPPLPRERVFQHLAKGLFEAELDLQIALPINVLSNFCGYMTMKEWLDFVDKLLLIRDLTDEEQLAKHFDSSYIAKHTLLTQLPKALLKIFKDGGVYKYFNKRKTN